MKNRKSVGPLNEKDFNFMFFTLLNLSEKSSTNHKNAILTEKPKVASRLMQKTKMWKFSTELRLFSPHWLRPSHSLIDLSSGAQSSGGRPSSLSVGPEATALHQIFLTLLNLSKKGSVNYKSLRLTERRGGTDTMGTRVNCENFKNGKKLQ